MEFSKMSRDALRSKLNQLQIEYAAAKEQNSYQNQGNWIYSSLILCCFTISKHLKCIGLISLNNTLLSNNHAILQQLLSNCTLCLLKTIST